MKVLSVFLLCLFGRERVQNVASPSLTVQLLGRRSHWFPFTKEPSQDIHTFL